MRLKKQKEYNEKRVAESQIVCNLCNSSNHLCRKCKNTVCNFCGEQDPSSDNEMHIMHKKNDKRCKVAESKIERQRRLNKQKEYDHEKRSAESEIDKQMRQTKDKITKHKRYTQSTQLRAKKSQQLREKRSAESEIDKEMRLTQDKEYQSRKRSAESERDKEMRLNKQKEYKREPTFMGPLQVWPMVYIGTALRGALYSLSYLLFVVCM